MRLIDSRRLTGVNLDLDTPGAIAEVAFDPEDDIPQILAHWHARIAEATHALDWPLAPHVRRYADGRGAALVFAAPPDALYLATDINDWALDPAARPLRDLLPDWQAAADRERVPGLAALEGAARERDLPLLLDDDYLTLGSGSGARTLPRKAPPRREDVPWDSLRAIPVALVTGTNGKTTTARMLARIARSAGHVPGNTSTDGLAIDEQVVEPGDWTGPGAARIVLRDPRVTLAVLEVARGGILRRGLAVDRCDVACITNIGADHLGEYGVDDLATMARVKAVVARVVRPGGRIVLGADSPELLDLPTDTFPAPVTWFSRDPDHPRLASHRSAGGDTVFVSRDGVLTRGRGAAPDEPLLPVADIPACFGGAAAHNVANALAAAACAAGLGLPDAAIAAGLRSFADNPGRATHLRLGDLQLFLDFAHNPHGIAAVAPLIARLRGDHRLLVSLGVAGDRRDDDIREVARAVVDLRPDLVLTRDLEHYLRGRQPGEVPALLEHEFAARGIACERTDGEVGAIRRALAWARPGDLAAILVHVDRDEVWAELAARGVDPPGGATRTRT
jgi:UDP-N-acetylmuramyl tripeptide synthase